jgi:Centromere DNA-binding protein complex CBF3 subunit, domain 2
MRVVAGFGSAKGTYFLRRSQESPPPALVTKLWPWVDAAVADYAAGGVPNPDLAGKEFLSLLQRLRYVFLQDAALLQPQFPRLRLWRLALFKDPAGRLLRRGFAPPRRCKRIPPMSLFAAWYPSSPML